MKPPLKTKSALTGKYVKAKGAKPETTYKSDDYPARMLRKLVELLERELLIVIESEEGEKLIANIKRRMKWK